MFPTYNRRAASDDVDTEVSSATAESLVGSLGLKQKCDIEKWRETRGGCVRRENFEGCGGWWVWKGFVGLWWSRFGERMDEIVAIFVRFCEKRR